jgi:hypothetical protein
MRNPRQIAQFKEDGYLVAPDLLGPAEIEIVLKAIAALENKNDRETKAITWSADRITMILGLALHSDLSRIYQYRPVLTCIEALIGVPVRVVGGILIDKDPLNNWDIGWHQDAGISSQAKEIVDFSPLVHRRATLQIFLPYYLYVSALPPGAPEDIRGGMPVLTVNNSCYAVG